MGFTSKNIVHPLFLFFIFTFLLFFEGISQSDAELPGLKKFVTYNRSQSDSGIKTKSVITEFYDVKGMLSTYEEYANGDTVELRTHTYDQRGKPTERKFYSKSTWINNEQKPEITTNRTTIIYEYDSRGNEVRSSSIYNDFKNYKPDYNSDFIEDTKFVYGKNDSIISITKKDNQHDFDSYREKNTFGPFGVIFKKVITQNSDVTDSTLSTYTYDTKGKLTKIKAIYYGWDGSKTESLWARDKKGIVSLFKKTIYDEKWLKYSVEFFTSGQSDSSWYYKKNKIDRRVITDKNFSDTLPSKSFFGGNTYRATAGRKLKFDAQGRLTAFFAKGDDLGKMHLYGYNEKNLVKRRITYENYTWQEGEPLPSGKADEIFDYEYEFY